MQGMALIVDALDNFSARFILNRVSFSRRLPFIHGAVRGFLGQATTLIPARTACLQCLFAKSPPPETIKVITGKGALLADRLFFWDGLHEEATTITIQRNPNCDVCANIG